jgi:hypothetical protein
LLILLTCSQVRGRNENKDCEGYRVLVDILSSNFVDELKQYFTKDIKAIHANTALYICLQQAVSGYNMCTTANPASIAINKSKLSQTLTTTEANTLANAHIASTTDEVLYQQKVVTSESRLVLLTDVMSRVMDSQAMSIPRMPLKEIPESGNHSAANDQVKTFIHRIIHDFVVSMSNPASSNGTPASVLPSLIAATLKKYCNHYCIWLQIEPATGHATSNSVVGWFFTNTLHQVLLQLLTSFSEAFENILTIPTDDEVDTNKVRGDTEKDKAGDSGSSCDGNYFGIQVLKANRTAIRTLLLELCSCVQSACKDNHLLRLMQEKSPAPLITQTDTPPRPEVITSANVGELPTNSSDESSDASAKRSNNDAAMVSSLCTVFQSVKSLILTSATGLCKKLQTDLLSQSIKKAPISSSSRTSYVHALKCAAVAQVELMITDLACLYDTEEHAFKGCAFVNKHREDTQVWCNIAFCQLYSRIGAPAAVSTNPLNNAAAPAPSASPINPEVVLALQSLAQFCGPMLLTDEFVTNTVLQTLTFSDTQIHRQQQSHVDVNKHTSTTSSVLSSITMTSALSSLGTKKHDRKQTRLDKQASKNARRYYVHMQQSLTDLLAVSSAAPHSSGISTLPEELSQNIRKLTPSMLCYYYAVCTLETYRIQVPSSTPSSRGGLSSCVCSNLLEYVSLLVPNTEDLVFSAKSAHSRKASQQQLDTGSLLAIEIADTLLANWLHTCTQLRGTVEQIAPTDSHIELNFRCLLEWYVCICCLREC